MADQSNDPLGLGTFSLGKANAIKPAPYQPQAPITYQNGQWTQNGQPVGPGTGSPGYAGGNGQPGAYTNAMNYLSKLNGQPMQAAASAMTPQGGGPASAPGMNLSYPGPSGANMQALWSKFPQLMGQAGGQINQAANDPNSALARALMSGAPAGWQTGVQ
jgi:hypothetical protein